MGDTQRAVGLSGNAGDAILELDFENPLVRAHVADALFIAVSDLGHNLHSLLLLFVS